MASKSGNQEGDKADVEELLDAVEGLLDRVKVLYEQYFLGIQKQAPSYLHQDLDRKLRDLAQLAIRNTAMRYRLATAQQKYGSYNTYWRRTLRQIENGTYARNLSRVGRQAARTGEAIPEEILAAMPKRMREQVQRDRQAALAQQQRRGAAPVGELELEPVAGDFDLDIEEAALEDVATIHSRPPAVHELREEDEVDVDALFAAITDDVGAAAAGASSGSRTTAPGVMPAVAPGGRAARPEPAVSASRTTAPGVVPATRPQAGALDDDSPATRATRHGMLVPDEAQALSSPPPRAPAPAVPARPDPGAVDEIDPPTHRSTSPGLVAAQPLPAGPRGRPAAPPRGGDEDAPTYRSTAPLAAVPGPPAAAGPPQRPTAPGLGTSAAAPRHPATPPASGAERAAEPAPRPPPRPPALPPRVRPGVDVAPPRAATAAEGGPPRPATSRLPTQGGDPHPPGGASPAEPATAAPGAAALRGLGGPGSSSAPPRVTPPGSLPSPTAPRPPPPRPATSAEAPAPPRPAAAPAVPAIPAIPAIPRPTPRVEAAGTRPEPVVPRAPTAPTAPTGAAPAPPSPPGAAAGTRPAPARLGSAPGARPLPRGVSEAEVSRLYDQYVRARSSVGESSDERTYDRLLRTIEQQAPRIMEQHRATGVEFQVVVKDNQVILRAKPKP